LMYRFETTAFVTDLTGKVMKQRNQYPLISKDIMSI
jgi:hypothetical protein